MISSGGFGCLYNPSLKCKKIPSSQKYITKIQKKGFSATNEFDIGKELLKFDKNFIYFLPIIERCDLRFSAAEKSMVRGTCEVLANSDTSSLVAGNLPYMEHYTFSNILNDLDAGEYFLCLTENFKYLLSALEKLGEARIIHYDLKLQNILFRTLSYSPRIVDFGISIPVDKVNKSNISDYFYVYAPDYIVWPLQASIINFMLHKTSSTLTEHDCKTIGNNHANNNYVFARLSSKDRFEKYKKDCVKYVRTFKAKERWQVFDDLLSTYRMWDNYSLSLIFASILLSCFPKESDRNKFIVLWLELLYDNMDPSMKKTKLPRDTYFRFLDLFYVNDSISSYLELRKLISVNALTATNTALSITDVEKPKI